MKKTKELLITCDWEREHEMDFVYLLEERQEQKPAIIEIIDLRKEKNETQLNILPF
jgi:hypothetical protein